MLVPTRHGSSDSYRYGFQGQEKDDELKGEGNSLNYTYRMHDPRIGRFFATDPLEPKYPFYSPYQFSGNRVIDMVELEGLEPAKPPKAEGEKEDAVDQNAIANNTYDISDVIGWMFGNTDNNRVYKTWVGHKGTETNTYEWVEEANYKQIIMPFAIDYAQSEGWGLGRDWESAKDLICNPSEPSDMISQETMNFLSSRNMAAGFRDYLTQIGAHEINSANKAIYGSVTGAITPMDLDSPFFGVGLGLKGFAMGAESTVAEGIIYKRTNPITGAEYFGQAKNEARFLARQAEENRALGVVHDFEIVERAEPGLALDVAEETHIRNGGGPIKKGGKLENARYQMNEQRYRAAGGKSNKPTK